MKFNYRIKKKIWQALNKVYDPELNISIVDLGLIYNIKVDKEKIKILMTLTSIGCPLFSVIEREIKEKLKDLGIEVSKINIELTFDPPWSLDMMTPRGKALLGI